MIMTNRTIQIIGQGFGSTPATVVATLDGATVFSGQISTLAQPVPVLPDSSITIANAVVLFTFEVPTTFTGSKPLTIEMTNGSLIFGAVDANYITTTEWNPAFSAEQLAIAENPLSTVTQVTECQIAIANPPFTSEQQATLLASTQVNQYENLLSTHNALTRVTIAPSVDSYGQYASDPRTNITIDGQPQSADPYAYTPPLTGPWFWVVNSGSVFACDINFPVVV